MATTNLLGSSDVYSRYYGNFRGVDFSSDHTQVHEQRLAFSMNMYRDYQSGQGQALETVPGFRRRVQLPGGAEVFGIHHFKKDGKTHILLHAGERLYLWKNYPHSINVEQSCVQTLPPPISTVGTTKQFDLQLPDTVGAVNRVLQTSGADITINTEYDADTHILQISRSDLAEGDGICVYYTEGILDEQDAVFAGMNERASVSFLFNNRLYLLDGKSYLVFDGEKIADVCENAYIPTTYINIIPAGENADAGTEHEQRNILQPKFKHTFVADGTTTVFCMNENELEGIERVEVYGEAVTGYKVDLAAGTITLSAAPQKPEDSGFPVGHAGVVITARKTVRSVNGATAQDGEAGSFIKRCTLAACFDGRVFFTGNPDAPNHVFYCERHDGYADPGYVGILDCQQDGVGNVLNTGMIPVANTLMVLKGDTRQDSAVYFHSPSETGVDLMPKVYPSEQGLAGIGCLGACINFLDDPVFVSRLGLEGVGQLSVRYERAIEHRSSLVDAKLVNLDLRDAKLEEWNGYLLLLVDGKIFMADSRQRYTHEIGVPQYEWYYLEDIGVFEEQYQAFFYAKEMPCDTGIVASERFCTTCGHLEEACSCTYTWQKKLVDIPICTAAQVYFPDTDEYLDLRGAAANAPDENGAPLQEVRSAVVNVGTATSPEYRHVHYVLREVIDPLTGVAVSAEALLCASVQNYTGGVLKRACVLKSMEDNLFFGTENGLVCSFNFDMRTASGELPPEAYSFDERIIHCGCATKMDCCGVPHLTKNTVKKSTVIKTRSFQSSAAKIKVRTNKKPYAQIARINSGYFAFDNVDFSDLSFLPEGQNLFAVREKEKQWMEKQYYVYSDEFRKPFALYYIAFRYTVAGRYKG